MHTSQRSALDNLKVATGPFLLMCLWFVVVATFVWLAELISANDQASLAWPVALALTVLFSIANAYYAIKRWPEYVPRVLLGMVTLAYTVLCVFSIYHHLAYREVVLQWRAIGGVKTPWELAPKPIPEDQNAYFWYERAMASLPEDDLVGRSMHEDHEFPWNESAQTLVDMLGMYESSLKEFHTATSMQLCVMPLHENDVDAFAYPPLAKYRELSRASIVEAVIRYRQGDVVGAVERLQANLAFVDHLLSQHRGAFVLAQAIFIEWHVLNVYQRMFADTLELSPVIFAGQAPFVWRHHLQHAYLVQCTLEPLLFEELFTDNDGEWLMLMGKFIGVIPYGYRISFEYMIPFTREVTKPHYAMDSPKKPDTSGWAFAASLLTPWAGLETNTTRIEVKQLQSLLAIRLREYKTQHGNYPDALDVIAADDLSVVDPWSGNSMYYERVNGGFILRSEATDWDNKPIEWHWTR